MRFHFITIPVFGESASEAELNRFVASHQVTRVERRFVEDGAESAWAVCVQYVEGGGRAQSSKAGLDYREVLSAQDFSVYAELRALRKTLAGGEGLPAYAIFTNEHLAAMVERRVHSLEELGAIEGVGKHRIDKYGKQFLDVLARALRANGVLANESKDGQALPRDAG